MLKKTLAASVVLAMCLCAVAVAGNDPAGKIEGTITRVDNDQKVLVIQDSAGQQRTVYWDTATKVSGGDLKEGATVTLSTSDQSGKMMATSIQVGASPKKPY